MQSLTFVLEASLLAPLVEFATSSSGHVEPRQGLALGWLGSVVAGLAVMFGAADRAQAGYCYNISKGDSGWVCSQDICLTDHDGEPLLTYEYLYAHRKAAGSNHCAKTGPKSCACSI